MSRNSIREKRRTARKTRLQTQRLFLGLALGGVLLLIGMWAINLYNNRSGESATATATDSAATGASSGLKIEDLVVGAGAAAKTGDTVEVHYTGTLVDGTKFDSSLDRGQTYNFTIGARQVIQGWEEGLIGMRVGGTRRLTIPPELGYGSIANGPIPANSTLIFEIQLISILETK